MRSIKRKGGIDPRQLPRILSPTEYRIQTAMECGSPAQRERYSKMFTEMGYGDMVERYAFTPVTSPGASQVSVPLSNFATAYAMDRNRFAVETIAPTAIVDKIHGKFWKFDAPENMRVQDVDNDNYAPGMGGGRPKQIPMEATPESYECQQRALSQDIDEITQQTADFDVKSRVARHLANQLQLRKIVRTMNIIQDTTSIPTHATATLAGGGDWTGSTAANAFIRKTFNGLIQAINQNSFNTADPNSLWGLMNPTTARLVVESPEFADHVKQSVAGERFLIGENPFSNARQFGMPAQLFGVNIMVVDTVILTGPKDMDEVAAPGVSTYAMADNQFAIVNSEPPSLNSMSTLTSFTFNPFRTEDHHIPSEHINSIQVLNTYQQKVTASSTGYVVTDVTS